MNLSLSRRDFVRTAVAGTLGVRYAHASLADQPPAPGLSVTRLAGHLLQISGAGANIVALSQPEGLLLVGGGLEARSAGVLALLDEHFPGQRIRVLFNTDWHREQTGLNGSVAAAGGTIIAHQNTRLWLGAGVHVKWQGRTYAPLSKSARPSKTFYTKGELTFGAERVVYGHLGQAHTDGDIYVYFPGVNVLAAGDVVSVGQYPIMDYSTGGWIVGLLNATRTLSTVANAETRIIPGDGPPQALAHLQAEQHMLAAVRDRVVKMLKSGLSAAEMIAAAPTKDFDSTWGTPDLFMKNMYPGLWGHARELGGII